MKKCSLLLFILFSVFLTGCNKNQINYKYIVDLPDKVKGAPVVFMLHGFGSTAENFKDDTKFGETANKRGYAVIYINSSSAGWSSGAGADTNDDVKGLCNLAKSIQKEFQFDKNRMYVAGYSNGGFMVHRLITEGKGTFKAGICVAGDMSKSVWKDRKSKTKTSFFQISGEKDDAVPKKSNGTAAHSLDPAIEDVLEYYAASDSLDISSPEVSTVGNDSVLTKYNAPGVKNQVWHLFVADGRHAWPSMKYNNIDINSMIIDFLDSVQ